MSAAALCTHDGTGDFFTMVNDRVAGLAPFWRVAAQAAWNAIVGFLEANKTELTISNAVLLTSKWLEGYGLSFLSKGLYALQHLLGVIERETHSNRRKISFTARLRGSVREPATATPEVMAAALMSLAKHGSIWFDLQRTKKGPSGGTNSLRSRRRIPTPCPGRTAMCDPV